MGPATQRPSTPQRPPPAPAPVAAPALAPAAHTASAEDAYKSQLRAYLNSIKRYPNSREARQLRPTGTVRLWLEIDRSGQLINAGIETSAGTSLLDVEALRTVRGGRYPAMPEAAFGGEASHRFTVPIEYTLDS